MDSSLPILSLAAGAVAATAAVAPKLKARIELSRAKHRSLTGHFETPGNAARKIEPDGAFRGFKRRPDIGMQMKAKREGGGARRLARAGG